MRIAIIVPSNVENAPYIKYYTNIFDTMNNIEYVYITWNRYKMSENINKHYVFDKGSNVNLPKLKKYYHYKLFSNYVKQILEKERFDFIIVFTIQAALFLSKYLVKNYRNKFIFDIRDYSPLYYMFKKEVEKIIKYSAATTISSLGFQQWLPSGYNYLLGHNTEKELINEALIKVSGEKNDFNNNVSILTIGQLRDFSENSRLILSLRNSMIFSLYFVGDGRASHLLRNISQDIRNVFFLGRYLKEDESNIVDKYDLINILLPITLADTTLMSNRFYLSLIHRKPMIVNYESIQANYVSKYNVGLVIKKNDDIPEKVTEYLNAFDVKKYSIGCRKLLEEIKCDINKFEETIISILKY